MRCYLVGNPEPVLSVSLLTGVKPRKITEEDIANNLSSLEDIKIFTNFDDAASYARSLRVNRAIKIMLTHADDGRRKIAPVLQMDITNPEKYKLSEENMTTETVTYKHYESLNSNFPTKNNSGQNIETSVDIKYVSVSKANIDLKDFKLVSMELPDTNFPSQNFAQSQQDCVLV